MKYILINCFFLIYVITTSAQEFSISGQVKDSISGSSIQGANVLLRSGEDQSFIAGTITNSMGFFYFNNIPPSRLILTISYIGYNFKQISFDKRQSEYFGEIKLSVDTICLDEIIVEWKPLIEYDEEGSVALNIDEMGNVDNLSVADVIQTIPGLLLDFNGRIHYNGYDNFTTLIDGNEIGSRIISVGDAGNMLKLSQIPAKYIKRVEVIPEPNGKFGYYTPILNIIPKGDLRDTYNSMAELGSRNKYSIGFGGAKKIKKFMLRPSISYINKSQIEKQEENRIYTSENLNNYFLQNLNEINNSKFSPSLGLNYNFDRKHWLKLNWSSSQSDNIDNSIRNTDFKDQTLNKLLIDNRTANATNYNLSFAYYKQFYLGIQKSLILNFIANNTFSKEIKEQENGNTADISEYFKSFSDSKNSSIAINVDYKNLKHKFSYYINSGFSYNKLKEFSEREVYDFANNEWNELQYYSNNNGFDRIIADLRLSSSRVIKKKNRRNHFIKLELAGFLKNEATEDFLTGAITRESKYYLEHSFQYRFSGSGLHRFHLYYNGKVINPSGRQLFAPTVYIDENTLSAGNPALKPVSNFRISANLDKSNNFYIIGATSKISEINNTKSSTIKNPKRIGYNIGFDYAHYLNEIIKVQKQNEDGMLVYTWDNSDGRYALSLNGNLNWNINKKHRLISGCDFRYNNYRGSIITYKDNSNWSSYIMTQSTLPFDIKMNFKYSYHSSSTSYYYRNSEYYDANFAISKLYYKKKLDISLAVDNIFSFKRKKIEYFGDGFYNKNIIYVESPVIWLKIIFLLFSYYEKN